MCIRFLSVTGNSSRCESVGMINHISVGLAEAPLMLRVLGLGNLRGAEKYAQCAASRKGRKRLRKTERGGWRRGGMQEGIGSHSLVSPVGSGVLARSSISIIVESSKEPETTRSCHFPVRGHLLIHPERSTILSSSWARSTNQRETWPARLSGWTACKLDRI